MHRRGSCVAEDPLLGLGIVSTIELRVRQFGELWLASVLAIVDSDAGDRVVGTRWST
jgi:hypothetical protein